MRFSILREPALLVRQLCAPYSYGCRLSSSNVWRSGSAALFLCQQGRGPCHGHRWSPYSHVKPGTQEGAAERVDVAPRAAINRRTKDIGQLFGRQITICKPAVECSQYLSRFSSAVEQRFCKPKVGSSILSTGTSKTL